MISVSVFKFGGGHSNIGFCLGWGLVGDDCCLVNKIIDPAFPIKGAGILLLAVAGWVRIPPLHYFGIVGRNYLFKVRCSPVGHFDSVPVDNFVEGVVTWKVLL